MIQSLERTLLIKAIMHRLVLFGLAWLTLVAGNHEGLLAGVLVVPLALALSLRFLPPRNPLDLWRMILLLPRFLKGSILGGVDVARRALAPSMPINPGWMTQSTSLPGAARVVLGAELSLMPGTLSAGTHEEHLLVHVLDSNVGIGRIIDIEEAALASIMGLSVPPRKPGGRA
jgi:multicomponent Na+:H+ antiporter subunit E